MSVVTRGRVIKAADAERARPLLRPGPSEAQRARMSAEEVAAHQNADRILHIALTRSEAILGEAEAKAAHAAKEAARRAVEDEQGRLAAAWLALRETEEQRAAREIDRAVALAQLLAERLIGRALALDPAVVAELAQEALAEARGARRVRLEANPLDVDTLRSHLAEAGFGGGRGVAIDVVDNAELARGSLRVHTEFGTLDARLHPRLERLAAALRDALRPA